MVTTLSTPVFWLLWPALGVIYWLPSIIGGTRHVTTFKPIAAINLLLGWTVLGWIVALVMALWPQATAAAYAPPQGSPIR